jgi:prepilin-type N-terminal cleavage/methylation domain-containing protein
MSQRQYLRSQHGFTIVELMIATLIFTVILVVITTGVIKFTSGYYKGLNSSATQTTARALTDDITQGIQYVGGKDAVNFQAATTAAGGAGVLCIDNIHFDFIVGSLVGPGSTYGVYETTDNVGGSSNCLPADHTSNTSGRELLGPHMRLTDIDVELNGVSGLYDVSVGIAYADDNSNGKPDLLCNPNLGNPGGCGASDGALTATDIITDGKNVICKSQTGSQFCSAVHLSTAVQPRLIGNASP